MPNISLELRGLLETSIASYCQNLQKAVHDIVLRDVKYNLRAQLPACFQGQLDRDITVSMARHDSPSGSDILIMLNYR